MRGRSRQIKARLRRRIGWSINDLNLTSLTDMFAFILVFLLKTFSVTYFELKPPGKMNLPTSNSLDLPQRYIAIDVQADGIYLEKARVQHLTQYQIQLETKETAVGVSDTLPTLSAALQERIQRGAVETTTAIIRADRNAPFELIWRVMFTARQLGFEEFQNLAIQRKT